MLSLFMVFLVFGSLLPLAQDMQARLELKKERLAAFETMHEAAKVTAVSNATAGERTVNGIRYVWFAGGRCVKYTDFRGEDEQLCVD